MSKSKQQTRQQVRQGKFYNCAVCNAWCSKSICSVECKSDVQYCGRFSDDAKTNHYFCSVLHQSEFLYEKAITEVVPYNLHKVTDLADAWKKLYRSWLGSDVYRAEYPNPLNAVKALTALVKWLTAYEHTDPYTRQETKYKVLKLLGDAFEDYHTEECLMSEFCYYIDLVKGLTE